jgi:hypothetical protein
LALEKRQFAITEPQSRWLNEQAQRQGKSANEVLRTTLETHLASIGNPHLTPPGDPSSERPSAT